MAKTSTGKGSGKNKTTSSKKKTPKSKKSTASKKTSPAKKSTAKKSGASKKKTNTKTSKGKSSTKQATDSLAKAGSNIAEELTRHAKDALVEKVEQNLLGTDGESGEVEGLTLIKGLFSKHDNKDSESGGGGAASLNADQLRELKKLLDEGVITKEDFEAKKKKLLGL